MFVLVVFSFFWWCWALSQCILFKICFSLSLPIRLCSRACFICSYVFYCFVHSRSRCEIAKFNYNYPWIRRSFIRSRAHRMFISIKSVCLSFVGKHSQKIIIILHSAGVRSTYANARIKFYGFMYVIFDTYGWRWVCYFNIFFLLYKTNIRPNLAPTVKSFY